jgi:hypothetical protein
MKFSESLGKHVDRISVWSEPVGHLVELDDGSFVAIGYNRIVTYENVAALRAGDHSWDRDWNVTGLQFGHDTITQFIAEFYTVVTDEQFFVDVVRLIDGSGLAVTGGLIAHIDAGRVNHIAQDADALIAHYLEFAKSAVAFRPEGWRKSAEAQRVAIFANRREFALERLRQFEYMGMGIENADKPIGSMEPGTEPAGPERLLNWQHLSMDSEWVGRIVGRGGPFYFNIFEDGHVSILEDDEQIEGKVAAVTIYHYGNRSGEYVIWTNTMETAVELSKARALKMIMNESGDLYHAAIHVIAHDPGPLAKLARCEIIASKKNHETLLDKGTAENV